MEKTYKKVSLTELPKIATDLIQLFDKTKVVLFYGHMGAGKTTFINAICTELQVIGGTSSPTFSIVNEYLTENKETLYHFDFYRLKSEMEAFDLGYEDYLYSGNVCMIEWPEKISNLLPNDVIEVHINGFGDEREIKFIW